jgi:hypothetical protein
LLLIKYFWLLQMRRMSLGSKITNPFSKQILEFLLYIDVYDCVLGKPRFSEWYFQLWCNLWYVLLVDC